MSFSPKSTLSKTSSHGKRACSWNITMRSRPGPDTGVSSTFIVPLSGLSSPATRFSSVDFPQPLGPTRHTNSPSPTFRLTFLSASTFPLAELKVLLTSSTTSFAVTFSSSA